MATPAERVASDPGLRRLVEVARSWGVSPSVFSGRPLITSYVYDDLGRMVSSATESSWTEDDRDLAAGLVEWEANLCGGCRRPLTETTDPQNEERYDAKVAARCHCCTAVDIAQNALQERQHPGALMLSVELRKDSPNQGDDDEAGV